MMELGACLWSENTLHLMHFYKPSLMSNVARKIALII